MGESSKMATTQRKGRSRTPLSGFSFYFDLNGKHVDELGARIEALGGVVDHFLSNNVSYFIREKEPNRQLTRKSSRLMGDHAQTRASMILKKVYTPTKGGEQSITPTLDRAKRLGISIHTVEKLSAWLKDIESQYPRSEAKQKLNVKPAGKTSENNVRKLRPRFFKVEDKRRQFQPFYKESASFPVFSFDQISSGSAFREPIVTRQLKMIQKSCRLSVTTNQNLKTALASTNYTKLDKLIQNADNFKDFMNRLHNGNNKLVSMQHTARKSQKTKSQMDSVAKSTNDISKKRKRTTSSGSSSRSSSTLIKRRKDDVHTTPRRSSRIKKRDGSSKKKKKTVTFYYGTWHRSMKRKTRSSEIIIYDYIKFS